MDLKHYEKLLLAKKGELEGELPPTIDPDEVGDTREVGDGIDTATAQQTASLELEESALRSGILEQVNDALARMKDGTYGECLVCGETIPPARLEALPWAALCIRDQERAE